MGGSKDRGEPTGFLLYAAFYERKDITYYEKEKGNNHGDCIVSYINCGLGSDICGHTG